MAPRKKTEKAESPAVESLVERLRDQNMALANEKFALEAEVAKLKRAKERPSRKFETETIRVNGFTITVKGKDCDEAEVWIERVGDSVVILTGRAAEAKRNGEVVSAAPSFAVGSVGRSAPLNGGEPSWTNLDKMGGSPIGLGPSANLSDEDKAKMMVHGTLEQIASNIIASGGTGIQ